MKIEVVAFDIDGTLYPNSRYYRRVVPSLLKSAKLIYHFGNVRKELRTIEQIRDFNQLQIECLSKHAGISKEESAGFIKAITEGAFIDAFNGVKPYTGVKETLASLKSQGVKLAALSDLPVNRKLALLGLEGWWDATLSSCESHYLKPRKEPFLLLAERVNTPPNQILYVGNNYQYDIEGASKAGFYTAHISKKRVKDSLANFTFSSYSEFLPQLEKLRNLCDRY